MNRIIIFISLVVFFACNSNSQTEEEVCWVDSTLQSQFVQLKNNQFQCDDSVFMPIMLNYVLNYRYVADTFSLSPHVHYEDKRIGTLQSATEINERFRAHFECIREMGFNTLRLCFDRVGGDDFYIADDKKMFVQSDYEAILQALDTVVSIAKESDLKIMLLVRQPIDNQKMLDFTVKILQHFCSNPTIFAYDFINEPLYFDANGARSKEQVLAIVNEWKTMMTTYAPHQLLTIGFAEPLEVFRWDPQLLPVDFMSFHTYHPLRVPSEIYWYSTYINKPFMIGEVGLPADNDSVSYEEQRQFMKESYEYARDCGAIGYGWWEFQETYQGDFNARYTGILNKKDSIITKKNKYVVYGTAKPAVEEIAHFANYVPQEKQRPVNYNNMLGYSNFVIQGSVINGATKKPIEGAVIRGWNKNWSVGVNTFTDSLGNFTLFSNDKCVRFKISAPGMTTISIENSNFEYSATENVVTHIDSVPNRLREYQKISYKPFVDSASGRIFASNSELFSKAQYATTMKPIYLKPIAIKKTEFATKK